MVEATPIYTTKCLCLLIAQPRSALKTSTICECVIFLRITYAEHTHTHINTLAVRILYFLYKRQKTTHVLDFHIFRPKKKIVNVQTTPTASKPPTCRTVPPPAAEELGVSYCAIK